MLKSIWSTENHGTWKMHYLKEDSDCYVIEHLFTGKLSTLYYGEDRIKSFSSLNEALHYGMKYMEEKKESYFQTPLF